MFGKLLSTAIKVVTVPVDIANSAVDIISGGDGGKESRSDNIILGDLERIRDDIADAVEGCDE